MNERGRVLDFRPKKENGDPTVEKREVKAIEIVRFSRPESVVLVRCTLQDGIVHLEENREEEGSTNIIAELEGGIPNPTDPSKKLFPKDGEEFLRALPLHYKTVYLGAREARENN